MTCFCFSGQWKYGGACLSTAGLQKEKRLCGPENAIARGEKDPKISSCGSGRKKKSCARPEKAEKRVWKVDFHESDPNRRKISLHNAKKYAIAGLREKKAVSDTHIAMQAGKTPEIFEEQVCGNRKKPSKGYRQDK